MGYGASPAPPKTQTHEMVALKVSLPSTPKTEPERQSSSHGDTVSISPAAKAAYSANPTGYAYTRGGSETINAKTHDSGVMDSFLGGFVDSVGNAALGIAHDVAHPVKTAENLYNAVAHPVQTEKNMVAAAKQEYSDFTHGNATQKAAILGNLTGDVATTAVGGGAIAKSVEKLSAAGKATEVLTYTKDKKIDGQMIKRGWTSDDVNNALNNPRATVTTTDARHDPATGKPKDPPEPATAYYHQDGGYVVRNDKTGNIVQVSGRDETSWDAPWGYHPPK